MNYAAVCRNLESRYREYLKTSFYFRDPALRASFEQQLAADGALSAGPYLEAASEFVAGPTLSQLAQRFFAEPPDPAFLGAVGAHRTLYKHQAKAITDLMENRNVVVATGTGSGKTECFLFPILLRLYSQFRQGTLGPGVRALVLYPMNALANDQRRRLGEIARKLEIDGSPFRFTFGQYVGDTPRDEAPPPGERLPGETTTRAEMHERPPHILLTNFSMLEYLLIRPNDSPLFDGGRSENWEFLVLDEAHQYRGARGTEMALLLRRLKRALREGGRTGPFRCIATSASLSRGEGDRSDVAAFARDLFGEPFDPNEVVLPSARPLSGGTDDTSRLHALLSEGPRQTGDLARELHPERPSEEAEAELAESAVELCRSGVAVRYHFYLRALEGAYVTWDGELRVALGTGRSGAPSFELALCRECGQHYLVAARDSLERRAWRPPIRDRSDEGHGAAFFLPVPDGFENEDTEAQPCTLCLLCGNLAPGNGPNACGHGTVLALLREPQTDDQEDRIPRCRICRYLGTDPVREVVHGADGPHSVLATALTWDLPEDRRKVLAFADSRQSAAFFAWFLGDTAERIWARQLLARTVRALALVEPRPRLRSVARSLAENLPSAMADEDADILERRTAAWKQVCRELLTDERRISLEETGVVRWTVEWPADFEIPKCFTEAPFRLSRQEARDLFLLLLDTLRHDGAVELPREEGVALRWADLGLPSPSAGSVRGSAPPRGREGVSNWSGERTDRVGLLTQLLREQGIPEAEVRAGSVQALREAWDALRQADILTPVPQREAYRLRADIYRAEAVSPADPIYRCQTCLRLSPVWIRGHCPRPRCGGRLQRQPSQTLAGNHYRRLYEERWPDRLRVEEHTAQVDKKKAREYQSDFQQRRIHVLSCSTTFELGVDLGDLDVVFLRNVPPEPFNYVQRVGRTGRQRGWPGLAVTYCGRSPHDLYHFRSPTQLISGRSSPPHLSLGNRLIATRHMAATVLRMFFREHRDRFGNVEHLAGNLSEPSLVSDMREFLAGRMAEVEAVLRDVMPENLRDELLPGWAEAVAGPESRLQLAQHELRADYVAAMTYEREAAARGEYRQAEWAQARRRTISEENVLSFLSRKVVIPKYGFPVDVVELDTWRATGADRSVVLQRDLSLALAEYAPGSRLVANKLLWKSAGLKRVPEKEWERRGYRSCVVHHAFVSWGPGEPPQPLNCCPDGLRSPESSYIVPQFGFVTDRDEPPSKPARRPERLFSSRPYFAGFEHASAVDHAETLGSEAIRVAPAQPGRLVVLCDGRKGRLFHICTRCGRGFQRRPSDRNHRSPIGSECSGQIEKLALGHEIKTDVLRLEPLVPIPQELAGTDATEVGLGIAYSLVEGAAETLEVPSTDLNAVVLGIREGGRPSPLVLYDAVPGGAGLVRRLADASVLRRSIALAHERMAGQCGCADNESCYGCVRSYRNQFVHHRLRRGPTYRYLERLLAEWPRNS